MTGDATITAAAISAIVAAGVFVIGQVLQLRRDAKGRLFSALQAVWSALDRVEGAITTGTDDELNPALAALTTASLRLLPWLHKRDWVLYNWLNWHSRQLRTPADMDPAETWKEHSGDWLGGAQSAIPIWLATRADARRAMLDELDGANEAGPLPLNWSRRFASRASGSSR